MQPTVASAILKLLAPVEDKASKSMAESITCDQRQPTSKSSFRWLTSSIQAMMKWGCEQTLQVGCSVCQDKARQAHQREDGGKLARSVLLEAHTLQY